MEKQLKDNLSPNSSPFWRKMDACSLEHNGVRYKDALLVKPMRERD